MTRKPPIACTPCYVTYKQLTPDHLAGRRFHVRSDGTVYAYVFNPVTREQTDGEQLSTPDAKLVRQEASRQRRNRNVRERNQAYRDLGVRRLPGGGWE